MDNFDDIFKGKSQSNAQDTPTTAFDKQEWVASKQAERSKVYEMMDAITKRVLSNGDDFRSYLDILSRFDRYSTGNVLLILAQMPNATKLRDFNGWKDNNVSIKKNEKGIKILEPGDEYTREDGTTGVNYNVKKVFDISQTTEKIEHQKKTLGARRLIWALMQESPVSVKLSDDLSPDMGAYYDSENGVINILKGMSEQDIAYSLSREIAHAEMDSRNGKYDRSCSEFMANCVSYVICKKAGFDVSEFKFDKLPEGYSNMEPKDGRYELTRIRNISDNILEDISMKLEQQNDKGVYQPER